MPSDLKQITRNCNGNKQLQGEEPTKTKLTNPFRISQPTFNADVACESRLCGTETCREPTRTEQRPSSSARRLPADREYPGTCYPTESTTPRLLNSRSPGILKVPDTCSALAILEVLQELADELPKLRFVRRKNNLPIARVLASGYCVHHVLRLCGWGAPVISRDSTQADFPIRARVLDSPRIPSPRTSIPINQTPASSNS